MSKDILKGFLAGLLVGLVLLAVVSVYGGLDSREKAEKNVLAELPVSGDAPTNDSITVYLDGLPVDPVGKDEWPYIDHLPDSMPYRVLWGLAKALEQPVKWNAETQSLHIGEILNAWAPAEEGVERIAFVINMTQNGDVTEAVREVTEKYGEDRVVCVDWPGYNDQEQMVGIASRLARDKSIKALIIEAFPGTLAALDKLRETRPDMFIICCEPQEGAQNMMRLTNLVLATDEVGMGSAMVEQAQKLGAKVFVHYSFPRHMSHPLFVGRRELIKEKCAELGVQFVDATAPDPTSDAGVAGAQQYILEDVPKMIARYGKDTAFFSTNCAMQIPLIKAVADGGGIYPQPCCPSQYHGFSSALDIRTSAEDYTGHDYIITETMRILEDKGVKGRFSTWPVSVSTLSFYTAGDYAFKWMNGEVPKQGLDMQVLQKLFDDYAGVKVYTNKLVENGITYDNWLMLREEYITY